MNIEDIFIGAWVYATDFPTSGKNTAVKVVDINFSKQCINCEYDGITVWVWIGRVVPIPLTAEILRKNFPKPTNGLFWFANKDGFHCHLYDSQCVNHASILVKEVQQLQLAMKLFKTDKQIIL